MRWPDLSATARALEIASDRPITVNASGTLNLANGESATLVGGTLSGNVGVGNGSTLTLDNFAKRVFVGETETTQITDAKVITGKTYAYFVIALFNALVLYLLIGRKSVREFFGLGAGANP